MTDNEQYKVSFFKTKSPHSKANRNLIISLAFTWAVAVFGFQILLIAFNKPVPETAYTNFEKVWPSFETDQSTNLEDRKVLSRSILSVLSKNFTVQKDHQVILKDALSWNVYTMCPDSLKTFFTEEPNPETYALAKETIGLASTGFDKLMVDLLPSSLVKVSSNQLSATSKDAIPDIMKLYLVHNQSGLTDTTFLGFPFHYWYTAQFLLILFVILCLIYVIIYDRINRKYKFIEKS